MIMAKIYIIAIPQNIVSMPAISSILPQMASLKPCSTHFGVSYFIIQCIFCCMKINGQNMTDKNQNDAVEMLRNTPLGGTVQVVVYRQLMEKQNASVQVQ